MKLRPEHLEIHPELAFFLFALLLGARDIGAELVFSREPAEVAACFAFLICGTITVMSFLLILATRGLPALFQKLSDHHILLRVVILGTAAAIVYLVTFYMIIVKIGAGLFNLFDYGLGPILTGIIGIQFFGNAGTRRLLMAIAAYAVGIFLLFWGNETTGWTWGAIAILSPIGTSISDATTQWLLKGDKMTRSEVLFVRFLPATILIGLWIPANGGRIHLHTASLSIPLAIFCGFLPLWLLCTGLGRAALTKYAVWEFLIPAITFFATLPYHPENLTLRMTSGALIIMSAVVIHELKFPAKKSSAASG